MSLFPIFKVNKLIGQNKTDTIYVFNGSQFSEDINDINELFKKDPTNNVFNNVAAGLTFYYFLANVITIMQAIVIKKFFINEEAILAKIEEHKQKPVTKSRFQRKLEELQQQQQKKR